MNIIQRSDVLLKIIEGMDKVHENLIKHKRMHNTELVVMVDGKIVRKKA